MKKLTKYQSKGQVTSDAALAKRQKEVQDTTSRGFEPARASGKPSMSSFDPKRAGSSKKPVNDKGWATPVNEDRKVEDLFKNPYKKGGSVTALNKVQEMYSKKKK